MGNEMDELEECRAALAEIGEICSSYKGLKPRDEEAKEAPGEPSAIEVEIDAQPGDGDTGDMAEEPPPMSITELPSAREEPRRGRGRPRRGSY